MTTKTDTTNVRWLLAARPQGDLKLEDLRRDEVPVPELQYGQILVRTIYLSLDPYHRQLLDEPKDRFGLSQSVQSGLLAPIAIGETLRGSGIGEVIESRDPRFNAGDIVEGFLGYQTHCIARGVGNGTPALIPLSTEAPAAGDEPAVQKVDPGGVPLYTRLGVLGELGLTANVGLIEVGRPRPGETVFVSNAAGAVGQVAGQVAKLMGCRVVGSVGSDEKVRFCVDELGFDAAVNYKSGSVPEQIDVACPDGIDVYFDLVGGQLSDIVFSRLNERGRHVVCGTMAEIVEGGSSLENQGPRLYYSTNFKRIRVEGYILWDFAHLYEPYIQQLRKWWTSGKLKSTEHIYEGIDSAPQGLIDLFAGKNRGKALVRVGPDPFGT